jgi:hypothetical protein
MMHGQKNIKIKKQVVVLFVKCVYKLTVSCRNMWV